MRRKILGLVMLGLCIATSPAMAQSLVLGGTQLAPENSYSYLGAVLPFAGGRLGSGWFGTVFANYLTYHFQAGDPSTKVGAKAPGVNAGVGYAWQGPSYQLAISGSLGYQYFSVHPYDVTTTKNGPLQPVGGPLGDTVTFTPQVQAHYDFTSQWYASAMASYSFGQRAYWSRLRGGFRPLSWLSFGPEGVLQGGVNYRIHQVGAFIGVTLGDGWSVEGEGGVNYTSGLPSTGYGGFSFAKAL